MAFLPHVEHDAFLSYAHVDDRTELEDEQGWVERFANQAKLRLLKRAGEPFDIWRDPQLRRAQLFDPAIEKAVRGSAILLALISNRYLKSDYCKHEIQCFAEKAREEPEGLAVDNTLRVFPVLLYNLPPEKWPEECHGASGFMFHNAKGDDLGEPLDPDSDAFSAELRKLVKEIHELLETLRRKAMPSGSPAESERPRGGRRFRVFMADVADDVRTDRRLLRRELERNQVEVMPRIPPPEDESSHTEAVSEAVKRADLTVHLFGSLPGRTLDEDHPERTFPQEQMGLAQPLAAERLVLLPESWSIDDIDPGNPTYRSFLDRLLQEPREAGHLEVVHARWQQAAEAILTRRQKLLAASMEQRRAGGAPDTVFVDLHPNDLGCAVDLVAHLQAKKLTPVMIPSADPTPSTGRSLFEENLKKARFSLVVFGAVAREWVVERLTESLKLVLTHELQTRVAVYVAPPDKSPKDLSFPHFEVLPNMRGFEPSTLDRLLEGPE